MQQVLLLLALIALVAWLVLRQRRGRVRDEAPAAKAPAKETRYHAVSIKVQPAACEAAKAMSGHRFLSNAAPQLPLPDCDSPACRCTFIHHEDRRSGKERRSPFAAPGYGGGTGSFQQERRERNDRRHDAADDEEFF